MYRSRLLSLVAGSSLFTASSHSSSPCDSSKEKEWRYLSIYLTKESQKNLQTHLQKVGINDTPSNRVVIRSSMTDRDVYMYKPLYGERAAFRLKGIIKTEGTGWIVGVGRVSTVAGELLDDDCEAALPIHSSSNQSPNAKSDERYAMDLATRLKRADVVRGKLFWKGRIASQNVLKREYPAEKATFTAYNWADQLVVDGYLCGSDYVDENGSCKFDRSVIANTDVTPSSTKEPQNEAAPVQQSNSSEKSVECPVCKFMKGGPCKEQFLLWDACVQGMKEEDDLSVCFPVTVDMMKCMRNYEYYDIMTANSESKMQQQQHLQAEQS